MLALAADRREPEYQVAVESAERDAERIKQLAKAEGIPLSGAASLLRKTRLPKGRGSSPQLRQLPRYGGQDVWGNSDRNLVVRQAKHSANCSAKAW